MKTAEVNSSLIGKRVKSIATSLEVTGTIVGIVEDAYSKGVKITLDSPYTWGKYTYYTHISTSRKSDDWGNLQHTELIDEKKTKPDLNEIETKVFDACLEESIESDNGNEFTFDDLMNRLDGMSEQQVKGYLSQLKQKGYIDKLDGCYYDFEISK